MKIKYVVGNLFESIPKGVRAIIPHICNDIGRWGAGFVVPLGNIYPDAKSSYLQWYERKRKVHNKFELGNNQIINVAYGSPSDDPESKDFCVVNRWVVNMIAQHTTSPGPDGRPPVRYAALGSCLLKVARFAKEISASRGLFPDVEIHAPMFGAGLAGGDWNIIEKLIQEAWIDAGIPVTIYSLEPMEGIEYDSTDD
jgi:hypothetical protein